MTKLLIKKCYFVPIFVASIASIRYSSQWFMFAQNGLHCPSLISNFPPKKVPGVLPGDSISAKFDFKVGFCNKLSCQDAAFPRFWPLPASLVYIETLCASTHTHITVFNLQFVYFKSRHSAQKSGVDAMCRRTQQNLH